MSINRGKKFEEVVKQSFLKVDGVSIDRLHDQTTGYLGSRNICDFIVYKKPYEYYVECKSIHGNTFPLKNITDGQWELLSKAKIEGVYAGIICWWVDVDVTKWLPIEDLEIIKLNSGKSVRFDADIGFEIKSKKKRVFFDYDMKQFFKEVSLCQRLNRKPLIN